MRDALHCALVLAALVWGLPSILLAVAAALAFAWSIDARLLRVDRLLDVGRLDEARRVHVAVQRDMGATRRRARSLAGGASSASVKAPPQ